MGADTLNSSLPLNGIEATTTSSIFDPDSSTGLFTLIVPLLLIPPFFYYGFRRSRFVQTWENYVQDLKVIAPYLKLQDPADKTYVLGLLGVILICIAIGRAISIYSPLLFRQITDELSAPAGGEEEEGQFPWRQIAVFAILRYLLRDIMTFVQWIVSRRLEYQVSDRISLAAYNKLMSLSADYHDNKDSSATWLTVRNSGEAVSSFASNVCFDVIPNILDLFFGAIAFGSVSGVRLMLVLIMVLALYVVALIKTSGMTEASAEDLREAWEWQDELSSSTISNWWTVYLFGRVGYEKGRFLKAKTRNRELDIKWCDSHWLSHNGKHSVMSFGVLLLCMLVSRDIWHGSRNGGDLMLFLNLWNNLIEPVQNVLKLNDKTMEFSIDAQRLLDILREVPAVPDAKNAKDLVLKKGSVRFEDVSFAYKENSKDAVRNASFSIEGGQTIAIVGRSGGGKSTLLKLLLRGYETTSGKISIDGQDIKDIRKESLIRNISTVPQKIGAFNASITENLRYAKPDATLEECEEVCKAVGLHEKIVDTFDEGYEEKIGENGGKLSGGELQRLAIARILLRDAKIVLLDEATSSLDSETEFNIQEHLRKWAVGRTVIIVAHRLATISRADLVLAVKDGRVVEQGSHAELLAQKGYFKELWDMQQLG